MNLRLPEPVGALSADLVFMDCDGVIFDMNPAKTEGFRRALDGYPDHAVEKLIRRHKAHGGVSRYQKFDYFFRELHPVDDVASAKERALDRYRTFVQGAYRRVDPLPEALRLARLAGPGGQVHVVSGSDESGLVEVFEHHGISSLFDGIHGSPTVKETHLARIFEEVGASPDRAVFIGDGRSDFEAAWAHDVPFVFLAARSEWEEAPGHLRGWDRAVSLPDWEEFLDRVEA